MADQKTAAAVSLTLALSPAASRGMFTDEVPTLALGQSTVQRDAASANNDTIRAGGVFGAGAGIIAGRDSARMLESAAWSKTTEQINTDAPVFSAAPTNHTE